MESVMRRYNGPVKLDQKIFFREHGTIITVEQEVNHVTYKVFRRLQG